MSRKRKATQKKPGRTPKAVTLVFGEDHNDRAALGELVRALCPESPPIQPIRKPLVLIKDRKAAAQKKNASDIESAVRRQQRAMDVRLVVAHQDCDAIEPAHEKLSEEIEGQLQVEPAKVAAATPAWELEAWWYLWPEAVANVNRSWRPLGRKGTEVGQNSKRKGAAHTRSAKPKGQAGPRLCGVRLDRDRALRARARHR